MRLLRTFAAAGLATFAMLSAIGSASAGPSSGGHNWSGFYVGAVGSVGMFTVNQEDYWCFEACNAPTLQDWDASIGAQAGFNWQNGNLVLGLVGDWSTGFEQEERVLFDTDPDGVTWRGKWNSYGTVRAKAGLAVGNAMVYATGGIAIVDLDYSATEFSDGTTDCTVDDCASVNDTKIGFAVGAGAGFPVADHIVVTFEYLYIGMPWDKDIYSTSTTTGTDDYVSWSSDAHLARVSAVWEFN